MAWTLQTCVDADIDELMKWFPDAHSVDIWGGPKFRFPFTRESFYEDCRWQDFSTCSLRDPHGTFSAFGQMGSRYGRSHLARLITHPDLRGQGVGKKLLQELIDVARDKNEFQEVALFVYRDNEPAYQCYLSIGFGVHEYPDDMPMRDRCYYLTRRI